MIVRNASGWVRICLATAATAFLSAAGPAHSETNPVAAAVAAATTPLPAAPADPQGLLSYEVPEAESATERSGDDAPIDVAPSVVDTHPLQATGKASPETARASGDLWDRVRAGFSMPDLEGPLVESRVTWYTARPEQLKVLLERSRRYLFHIVEELEKRGMPTELALLPMVESAFNPLAYSRAHASGLWQFIPATGRTYNLSQNWWYDARRDVVASTTAALDYLQTIYDMHGHWHLALASYNWGENAVARAVERNQKLGLPADYASLPMPNETRWYVPKLQALKNIIANPSAYGVELDPMPNAPYFATVTLTRDIDLQVAARLAEIPLEELIALNPGHTRPVVSSAQASGLVLPADRLERFTANFASHRQPLSNWRTYPAQRGERVETIAAAHGISPDRLRQVNSIRGAGRLQESAELLVPVAAAHADFPLLLGPAPVGITAELPRVVRTVARRAAAPARLSSPLRLATYPAAPAARGKAPTPPKYVKNAPAPARVSATRVSAPARAVIPVRQAVKTSG